jgi:hypothetical protein
MSKCNNDQRVKRIAHLIMSVDKAITLKEKRMNHCQWTYVPIPNKLLGRRNALRDLRSNLFTMLLKSILGEDKVGTHSVNMWVKL